MIDEDEYRGICVVTRQSWSWDSNHGFKMHSCEHRQPPHLRCRVRWLIHLWRNGNHVWRLP